MLTVMIPIVQMRRVVNLLVERTALMVLMTMGTD